MTAMTAAKVLDYVNSQQHVLTGLLRDLVAAESPSAHPETHDEIRRILRLALACVGFDSREVGGPDQPRHVFARPAERQRQQPFHFSPRLAVPSAGLVQIRTPPFRLQR